MMTLEKFEEAAEAVKKVVNPTKLVYSEYFSAQSGNKVYLKPENMQYTGAYKVRGAYYKISTLSEEDRNKGLITASAGNHAQGVAYAAKLFGVKAIVVMPTTTPLIKVNRTKSYGAEVILYGDIYDEACAYALKLAEEDGMTFIHPFDDEVVATGQGTIAMEIFKELPTVDYILVPIGGGGLCAGVSTLAKMLNPKIKVIGVEPTGANAMHSSLINGHITNLNSVSTIADGVAVKNPGEICYDIIKNTVSDIIEVTDFEIMEAYLSLLQNHKLVSENSGSLSIAALSKLKSKNKKVVSLISGGNIDVLTMSSMINKGLISMGRTFCFSVTLPDVPGQLVKISKILADSKANVIKLDHNQFKSYNRFNNVSLEVTVETNGHAHIEEISDLLYENGYHIIRIY